MTPNSVACQRFIKPRPPVVVCCGENATLSLPLPIASLMATGTCPEVAAAYSQLDQQAKAWGSKLRAPYMTLSFMALLVIPALKLSDLGLFDGGRFEFVEGFER